jgi:hypothetical protein
MELLFIRNIMLFLLLVLCRLFNEAVGIPDYNALKQPADW